MRTRSPSLAPGTGQRLVDAELAQARPGVVERLEVGEVGQGHGPLGLATDHAEAAVVAPLDPDALGHRTVHDERLGHGLVVAHAGHLDGQAPDQLGQARAGDRRDAHVEPGIVGVSSIGGRRIGI